MIRSLCSLLVVLGLAVGCESGGRQPSDDDTPDAEEKASSSGGAPGGRGGAGMGGAGGGGLGGGGGGGQMDAAIIDAAAPDVGADAPSPDVGTDVAVVDAGAPGVLTTATAGPAAPLVGYRWELPCRSKDARDTCPWDPELLKKATPDPMWRLKIEDLKTFGGNPDTVYDVTLRFRGVAEPKNFTGGTVVQDHFQIGGTPVVSDYNIYSVKVSDPPGTYTLNRSQRSTGHYLLVIDYTVTIKIKGGAKVTLGTYDRNMEAIANPGGASGRKDPYVVPGVPPFPMPYYGHFIQMDVVSVAPMP